MQNQKRRLADESGFSLLELLIVISIIGILFGIIVPTAQEAAFQANVKAAVAEMKTIITNKYTENEQVPTLAVVKPILDGRIKNSFQVVPVTDVDNVAGIYVAEFELWFPPDPLAIPTRRMRFDWHSDSGTMIIMTDDIRS